MNVRSERARLVAHTACLIIASVWSGYSVCAAQSAPTAYTIVESNGVGSPMTSTIYRDGDKAVIDHTSPAGAATPQHSRTLYLLKQGTSYSWNPDAAQIECSTASFSGDWGDPFEATAELNASITKGDLKSAGTETVNDIQTKVYAGSAVGASTAAGTTIKVWLDDKDGLVVRTMYGQSAAAMQTLVNVEKFTPSAPAASVFELPASCAAAKKPQGQAEIIAAETGDSADNFVNAIYGPGSKASCTVLLRVVKSGTMAPVSERIQVAIDTDYDPGHPPSYNFGVAQDGTQTFAGGGIREITDQVHNGAVRIENPPQAFNIGVNLVKPGSGAGMGLIYRQCFAPTTILYYVVNDDGSGGDWLWAKAGRFAQVPAQ